LLSTNRLFIGCVLTALLGSCLVFSLSVLYAVCHLHPTSCQQLHPPSVSLFIPTQPPSPTVTPLNLHDPTTVSSLIVTIPQGDNRPQSPSANNRSLGDESVSANVTADVTGHETTVHPPLSNNTWMWWPLASGPSSPSSPSISIVAHDRSSADQWPQLSISYHLFINIVMLSAILSGISVLLLAHLLCFHIFLSKTFDFSKPFEFV
jgi:hypothetical protein